MAIATYGYEGQPNTPEMVRKEQDAAARFGLDLNLLSQYSLNPNAFKTQYGQFQDPTTGVFTIPGVTPGALMQNPNFAGGVVNPDGTPIRAGTPMTGGTSSGGGFTGLPNYGVVGVNELFDPNFGRTETLTIGAENAIAGGFAGSGFGGAQTMRLLDSERKANILAGHQILEPYLNREFQGSQNAADRASRLNEIAAEGAQALQRLQLSESGAGARLSAELSAKLQQQVLDGQQAMQRLTLTEAGATGRNREDIQGRITSQLLGAALTPGTRGGAGGVIPPTPSGPLGATYGVPSNQNLFNAPMAYNPAARGVRTSGTSVSSLLGGSTIDQLLRKYGLL